MPDLYTLDELLTRRANGYTCHECGALWLDHAGSPSLAFKLSPGFDAACRHVAQARTRITQKQIYAATNFL